MDIADYYRQLGLRSGASLSQVKASARKRGREYHPDVKPGNEQGQNKFIAVPLAYTLLVMIATADLADSKVAASVAPAAASTAAGGDAARAAGA